MSNPVQVALEKVTKSQSKKVILFLALSNVQSRSKLEITRKHMQEKLDKAVNSVELPLFKWKMGGFFLARF